MASDIFVRIDGIEAESMDEAHSGWMEVLNFTVGSKQRISAGPSSAGGATAGRADFAPLRLTRLVDKASPRLALACADGTHIDEIVLELCRAGGDRLRYMTCRMRNCIIKRVSIIGGGIFPMEVVETDYGCIEWIYTQQNRAGGGPCGQVAASWNREKNCRI
jgi:type VI secretion system secreted protein Hcp